MADATQIYEEVIQKSQENVNNLATQLAKLKQLHENIKELTAKSEQLPIEFDKRFGEIRSLSEKYTNDLGVATNMYLEGNNTLFTSHLKEFSLKIEELEMEIARLMDVDFIQLFDKLQQDFIGKTRNDLTVEMEKFDAKSQDLQLKINALQSEVSRLINTDFSKLFAELQKEFIKKTREDLEGELKKFDAKSEDLQLKINALQSEISRLINTNFTQLFEGLQKEFIKKTREDLEVELKKFDAKSAQIQSKIDLLQKEITRLENIDLEKHFDKLQKTLSDIFGAINALNLSFTTIIQTLNTLVQSVGNISTKLESNHADIQGSIKEFSSNILAHLKEQDIEIKRNQTSVDTQLKALVEQNEMLKKELKTNRMMLILGFVLVLIISAYSIFKH